MRVLIVSEIAAERLRAASALGLHADVEVVEVASGEEARRLVIDAEDGTFDVLVVDGDLRPRGGFALLYDLRAKFVQDDRVLPRSVVLLARPQDRYLSRWCGADRALLKPVEPFDLAAAVAELLADDDDVPEPESVTATV